MKQVAEIARQAGVKILKIYNTDFQVKIKDDQTPVTYADELAEKIIIKKLNTELPFKYPIISEEAATDGHISNVSSLCFWLVDPLDGTKEFINRNGDFTVNIGLIQNGVPIFGVVYVPAHNITYMGGKLGSYKSKDGENYEKIKCRKFPSNGLTALVSRSHRSDNTTAYLSKFNIANEISAGSSLKFCKIAEGEADIYPRLGPTMEWDTAAAHSVLYSAGGHIETLDGKPLSYGKPDLRNPHFVAYGNGKVSK